MNKRLITIWPGNSYGIYELGEIDVDCRYDWSIELTELELAELIELKAARDRYYKLCREYKAREIEPIC